MRKLTLLIFGATATLLLLSLQVNALINSNTEVDNQGSWKTVGVESDIRSLNWERLEPNTVNKRVVNFRNTGNTPSITLTMATTNWQPLNASEYMKLSWNYTQGTPVTAAWTPVTLTLTVFPNATAYGNNTFAFTTIVTGTG